MTDEKARHIAETVAEFTDGAAISDLEERLDIHRRTIQRRLKKLVARGELQRQGQGRATRYFVPESSPTAAATDELATKSEPSQPVFSDEAKEARRRIRAPLVRRQPVSYRAAFLNSYEPGQTTYLPRKTRDELRAIGSLTDRDLPAGTYARRILDRLLIDLSWNSSRLEGNTYSLLETERLIEADIEAEQRDPRETQMLLNHKSAIEFLVDGAEELGFHRTMVLNLHALLSENLLGDPSAEGRLRRRPVGISGTVYEPLQDPHRIEEYFDTILVTAESINDPFEQSFFALVQLPYLQAFLDANKRVSRLAANIPYIRHNLSPLSFVEVSTQQYTNAMLAIYEDNDVAILRDLFVWAYHRSADRYRAIRNSIGEPDPLRLRRRQEIKGLVSRIVAQSLSRPDAAELLDEEANSLPPDERDRFAELVWRELDSLHEGNFARYRVRPSQFESWRRVWDKE